MEISVIIPIYNTEKYLKQCVDSVLNQTFRDTEIILVDDGSTDNSPEMCDRYAENDKRIKVIHKENGGLSSARNAGLDIATGDYIAFIDSDDFYMDLTDLEAIHNKMVNSGLDILIIGLKKYFQQDNVYREKQMQCVSEQCIDKIHELMKKHIFVACACDKIYSRKFIESNGLRFVPGQKSEDIEWCIKLLLAEPNIDVLPKCIYVYRKQNETSITANIKRKNFEDIYNMISKYIDSKNIYIKHFLAVQYVQLLAITNLVESNLIKDILNELKKYYYLLDYNWYPYVSKIRKLKILGFRVIRKMLGIKIYGLKGCKR